ncbi:N5,N10-methylene tetrahydromethanopterin reductase [Alteribacter lacisalsi]|uniref:N5,N10-methylene tetrahydromethanopterin reductase n=1 Tax=Alteribacter lacisalsi TaxID=2045244 RepID=A0A2W0H3N6_9BACI|nr:LLM class flavin-dependent oxidoreductase [Alteribacter lacisalsi]PYZ95621.1 N5,N10-methylene tetrahydromethanopterin reductase [Alteribacter lacisalsi]
MTKQLILNAFDMTSAMHNSHGLWKHENSRRHREYKDPHYWMEIAGLLEKGKFDAVFFAEVLGIYDTYRQSRGPSLRDGMQVPAIDASYVVPFMASVTKHLSFAITISTTYEQPFSNARRFSSLDHLTNGRIAWNVVTSYLPNAARNFGLEDMVRHDKRYTIADEFLDVSYKLWEGSWEEEAVVEDGDNSTLVNPDSVHEINHKGNFFSVAGPHLSEPSPQRTPVLYQAGTSEKGRAFAARHAECIFVGGPTPLKIREYIEDIKAQARELGRNPDHLKFFSFLNVVVAPTTEEAERKFAEYDDLWSVDSAKAQFAGASGQDLSFYESLDPSLPFDFKKTEHAHYKQATVDRDPKKQPTIRQVLSRFEHIDRETYIVGNPQQVADGIQKQFEESGVDGFNLNHLLTPGDLEAFVDLVVPELQVRGIYKTSYKEGTLREKLFDHESAHLPDDHPGYGYKVKPETFEAKGEKTR